MHSKLAAQAALKDGLDNVLTHLDGLQAHPGWKYFSDYVRNKALDVQTTLMLAVRTSDEPNELAMVAKYHAGRMDGMLFAVEKAIETMQKELRHLTREETQQNAKTR